ncbi:MAG TPA: GNAT family N-acetyltransferase [Pseudonocardiaceae bacterium]
MTDELLWRPLRQTDVAAWHELLLAVESADETGENFDIDDLAEELADPTMDLARNTLAAFDGPDMVAYAGVRTRPTADVDGMNLGGAVHPKARGRGLGTRLLEWQVRRGNGAELHIQIHEPNQAKRDAYAAHGFAALRWFFDMHCDLAAEALPVGSLSDGLELVPFAPEYDGRVLAADREAFADHWSAMLPDEAIWQQWYTGSRAFRAGLSFLALDGAEVAGFVLGYESDADTAAKGFRAAWVGQIGTRRPWRGRGVASTLLRRFLATARDDGYRQAMLTVDSASPTGAVGLYQRHGFVRADTWIRYVRPA